MEICFVVFFRNKYSCQSIYTYCMPVISLILSLVCIFLLERTVVTLGPGQKLSYSLLITMMITAIMVTTFRVFAMCEALYTLVAKSLPGPEDYGYSGTD